MNPSDPGGNYPGNRPPTGPQGRTFNPAPPGYPANTPPYPAAPGYPQAAPQPYGQQQLPPQYAQMKPFSTKAIIAMVLGGVSVFCLVAPLTGVAGGILGYLGMRESKEPGGTHRGWGLALAGLILSGVMFLAGVAYYGMVVFAFVTLEEQQQRHMTYVDESEARTDLTLIAERLQLYAIENGNSIQAGGPVVRDGWSSSYGNDASRVKDRLQLTDLVREMELERPLSEYSLEVTSRSTATVRNDTTGTTLIVTNAAKNEWRIDQRSTP
jgi:hypothetical protein